MFIFYLALKHKLFRKIKKTKIRIIANDNKKIYILILVHQIKNLIFFNGII